MRRKMVMGLCAALLLTGCSSGISQEDYDAVMQQAEAANSENAELESSLKTLEEEKQQISDEKEKAEQARAALEAEKAQIQEEYDTYKEEMKPYAKLSKAEAEAKTAEAERKKAEAEQARKEKEESEAQAAAEAAAEAQAAKEAEEAAGYDTGTTYEQLARTPDDYMAKKVKFSGKVIQVLESDGETTIRLAVNSDYDQVIIGSYDSDIVSSRVLENDKITVMGLSAGLYSYTSTMKSTITIPSILIEKIEQ